MNTYITNCIVGNKSLQNGTIGYNIIDGRVSFLKNNGFTLNNKGKDLITKRLKEITLPKIIRITFVIMNEYQQFFVLFDSFFLVGGRDKKYPYFAN